MKTKNTQQKKTTPRRMRISNKFFSRLYGRYVQFPAILLSGKWLQELGFEAGQHVTIVPEKDKIIITREQE